VSVAFPLAVAFVYLAGTHASSFVMHIRMIESKGRQPANGTQVVVLADPIGSNGPHGEVIPAPVGHGPLHNGRVDIPLALSSVEFNKQFAGPVASGWLNFEVGLVTKDGTEVPVWSVPEYFGADPNLEAQSDPDLLTIKLNRSLTGY